jgi:hypothetical protein
MIVFDKDIATDKVLMAYNNNVIIFKSDSVEDPIFATVGFAGQVHTIFPSPDGTFYFNFKEYTTALLNQRNFEDDINPEIDTSDSDSFTYNWTQESYLFIAVTITVNLADQTSETANRNLNFLAGVEQLETYKRNESQTETRIILQPLAPRTNDRVYAKYWEGYPFDLAFLFLDVSGDFELTNETNLLSFSFGIKGDVTRLFFSDGRTDESINDLLPIALGRNVILWEEAGKRILLDKEDVCEGQYIKWLNNYGGYSYWLFPKFAQRNLRTRNQNEINKDFNNLEDTFSPAMQTGKETQEILTVNSDDLNEMEANLLLSIFNSPKIYLFTGEPFSRNMANDWVEVRLATGQQRVRNYKMQPISIQLDLELPEMYAQRL